MSRIPIFCELRFVTKDRPLKEYIFSSFDRLGFKIDEEIFAFYASTGKFVLMLDGFDEVDDDFASFVIEQIDFLADKFPSLQMVLTSRPDAGVQRSARFRVFRLAGLSLRDHLPFYKKLLGDDKFALEVTEAIKGSESDIKSMLKTPLLLNLLVLIYRKQPKVPKNVEEFYDRLFDILLHEHDFSKGAYRRKRVATLGEREARRLFEAFCFASRLRDHKTLTLQDCEQCLDEAMAKTAIRISKDKYLEEMVKIACLMQKEGNRYHFLHKSVQEFYASSFVANSQEKFGDSFYSLLRNEKWKRWRQELEFLSQIDSYKFSKFFFIPLCGQFFERIGMTREGDVGAFNYADADIEYLTKNITVEFFRVNNGIWDIDRILFSGKLDRLNNSSYVGDIFRTMLFRDLYNLDMKFLRVGLDSLVSKAEIKREVVSVPKEEGASEMVDHTLENTAVQCDSLPAEALKDKSAHSVVAGIIDEISAELQRREEVVSLEANKDEMLSLMKA